jgi:hypothetical protein
MERLSDQQRSTFFIVGVVLILVLVCVGTAQIATDARSNSRSPIGTPPPPYRVYTSTFTLRDGRVSPVECVVSGMDQRCEIIFPNGNRIPNPQSAYWSPDQKFAIFCVEQFHSSPCAGYQVWRMSDGEKVTGMACDYSHQWVPDSDHILACATSLTSYENIKAKTIFFDATTGKETYPRCPGWLWLPILSWTREACHQVPAPIALITASNQFSTEIYPPAHSPIENTNWWGDLSCPNEANIEPASGLSQDDLHRMVLALNSPDILARRQVTDPAVWPLLEDAPWPTQVWYTETLGTIRPAIPSPYGSFLADACGQGVVNKSVWVQNCGVRCRYNAKSNMWGASISTHLYILKRNGRWLIWAIR